MKKDIFALSLLALILALSLWNIAKLEALTEELSALADKTAQYPYAGDPDSSVKAAKDAISLWDENDSYTHIVLRHGEIDMFTAELYEMLDDAESKDLPSIESSTGLVKSHLDSIISIEKIRLGSIFTFLPIGG